MSSAAIVSKVDGAVFVIRGGQEIALSQGMELEVSDSIRTGMNGQCELRFADDTEVQLSPMSQVQIQDFAFNPGNPSENSFAMHMMEGLVRTVSGEVVKLNPEGFALSTPLGTAGIRGTTVIAQIFPTHVVFMVTEMGSGNSVVINSVFGGELTILMPGQGAELSLTEQQRITLIDSMPEHMRDAVRDFFENQYDDLRSSHDNSILLFGDIEFLAAMGAENVGRGVGMLSAESEDILIELLQELGVEQPEFFLEGPPQSSDPDYIVFWGDNTNNTMVPNSSLFGPDFKNLNYDIRGFEGDDIIVAFNGTDTIYGGQGSEDKIYKISDEITAGNLIVGGDQTLSGKTGADSLDDDVIVLRAQGQSTDDEQGWTSQNDTDYGATLMSGGSVVGSAVNLTGSDGGYNVISLYGSMTGGAIYGKAVTAVNCNLGDSAISVSQVLGADGVTMSGGILDGGIIYGDAKSMTGGQAGGDYISVDYMKSGAIYGDAQTGSYTPGNNSIYVTKVMSGGTIYTGNGDNGVIVELMEGGTIMAGKGEDNVEIRDYMGGDIYMGLGGNNQQLYIVRQGADLLLKGVTGGTEIIVDGTPGGTLGLQTLAGALNVTSEHANINIGTFAGDDSATTYQLQYNETTTLNIGTWLKGDAYVNTLADEGSRTIRITEAKNGTLALSDNIAEIGKVSGAFTIFGNQYSNPEVSVGNLSGSLSTDGAADFEITVAALAATGALTTGAGNDIIRITAANGGTVSTGAGDDDIYVSNGTLTIDGLDDDVSLTGSGMNITLVNSGNGTLNLDALTGSNTISADDSTGVNMSMAEMKSALSLAGKGADLIVNGWQSGSLDYSDITGSSTITVSQDTISGIDISGAGGSTGAVINLTFKSLTGTVTGSAGADIITLTSSIGGDSGAIDITGTVIDGRGGADEITSNQSLTGGNIILGDPGSGTNVVTVNGHLNGTSITGSAGSDIITVTQDVMYTFTISTGAGEDVVNLSRLSGNSVVDLGSGGNELNVNSNISGAAVINMSDPGSTSLWNKVTADGLHSLAQINGSAGRESIVINGEMSGGTIALGAGNDSVHISHWSDGSIDLGAGADTIKLDTLGSAYQSSNVTLDLGVDSVVDIVDLSDLVLTDNSGTTFTLTITNAGSNDLIYDAQGLFGATGTPGEYTANVNGTTYNIICGVDILTTTLP